jgi:hypothetical protein
LALYASGFSIDRRQRSRHNAKDGAANRRPMAVFTELEREQVKRLGADRVAAPKQDLRTLWNITA